jgi:predicted ATPase
MAPLSTLLRALTGARPPVLVDGERDHLLSRAELGHWAVQDIRSVIERTSAAGPFAVVIDDAGWADDASLHAIRLLCRALESSPVVWVLASRPGCRRGVPATSQ